MSTEPIQNPLFDEPLGLTLRHARQRKDLSVEAVARQLKLPVAVVDALERESWQSLGAPIYVKSYVESYLKLLGLPLALAAQLRAPRSEPALVAMGSSQSVQRSLDRSWRRLIYVGMTIALVGSVAMLAMHLQGRVAPIQPIPLGTPLDLGLDPPPAEAAPAEPAPASSALLEAPAAAQPVAEPVQPVAAAIAPVAAATRPAGGLVLRFRGDSWVDIVDSNGQRLERGMVPAGAERSYPPGSIARMTLGNASMVELLQDGRPVDLDPYSTENVARFAVSSDGRISPPGG